MSGPHLVILVLGSFLLYEVSSIRAQNVPVPVPSPTPAPRVDLDDITTRTGDEAEKLEHKFDDLIRLVEETRGLWRSQKTQRVRAQVKFTPRIVVTPPPPPVSPTPAPTPACGGLLKGILCE